MKEVSIVDEQKKIALRRDLMLRIRICGQHLWFRAGEKAGQKRILMVLFKRGNMTQRELQDILEITSAALSETLAKVEAEGLVQRVKNEKDKRQINLSLTEKGRKEAEGIEEEGDQMNEELLSDLSLEEQEQLLALLDKLAEKWTKRGGDKD